MDGIYQETILNIIICRTKIGYCRLEQKIISRNLSSAINNPDILTTDLENQIAVDQLIEVSDLENHFISFLLGLALKSNGKWCKIHHLLYLRGRSVNYSMPKQWGAHKYTTFDEARQEVIQTGPGSTMVKCNLRDAFQHISVSPHDWWLLEFSWNDKTWINQFLSFGHQPLPFLFDLFAKGIH